MQGAARVCREGEFLFILPWTRPSRRTILTVRPLLAGLWRPGPGENLASAALRGNGVLVRGIGFVDWHCGEEGRDARAAAR